MEFTWSDVILEGINFLVLVWLLKHFLYRPVLEVIEQRRARSEQLLDEAKATRADAEKLKNEYNDRLTRIDKEQDLARAKLDTEIASERQRRLDALETEVNADRERRRMLDAREKHEQAQALERNALNCATRFTSHLLDQLACAELDARLTQLALKELEQLPTEKREALQTALQEPNVTVKVVTAYVLGPSERNSLNAVLQRLAGHEVTIEFYTDPALKSGLHLTIGAWALMANLRDELDFFAGAFAHER